MVELSEKEFLTIIKSRIDKANLTRDKGTLQQLEDMYETYKKLKEKGYICKFYFDNDTLYLYGYAPKEYEIIMKKYRECGIW